MFVHEEGKIINLPVNYAATKVYWNNTLVHRPKLMSELDDLIHGTAVLFKQGVVT
jgi:hypothetical protein